MFVCICCSVTLFRSSDLFFFPWRDNSNWTHPYECWRTPICDNVMCRCSDGMEWAPRIYFGRSHLYVHKYIYRERERYLALFLSHLEIESKTSHAICMVASIEFHKISSFEHKQATETGNGWSSGKHCTQQKRTLTGFRNIFGHRMNEQWTWTYLFDGSDDPLALSQASQQASKQATSRMRENKE